MALTVQGGLWEGRDMFEGVGLGVGQTIRLFTAEVDVDEDSIKGVGTDESGTFRLEGRVERFNKSYDDAWCDSIEYQGWRMDQGDQGDQADQGWINGTYKFVNCSTKEYKSKNPFLGLFAPSFTSGKGTFEMACKSDC